MKTIYAQQVHIGKDDVFDFIREINKRYPQIDKHFVRTVATNEDGVFQSILICNNKVIHRTEALSFEGSRKSMSHHLYNKWGICLDLFELLLLFREARVGKSPL